MNSCAQMINAPTRLALTQPPIKSINSPVEPRPTVHPSTVPQPLPPNPVTLKCPLRRLPFAYHVMQSAAALLLRCGARTKLLPRAPAPSCSLTMSKITMGRRFRVTSSPYTMESEALATA